MTSTRVWTTTPCSSRTSTPASRRPTLGSRLRRSTRWSTRGLFYLTSWLTEKCNYKYIYKIRARRREYQQDDHQEVFASFEIWLTNILSCREEPIPEEKRESCANTELGPEVHNAISIPVIIVEPCKMQVKNNCTIFLGYTSNMASCGVRETLRCQLQILISMI